MEKGTMCYGCLSDIGIAEICPHCGFDESRYQQPYNALALGTTLDDRYVIGKVLGSGGFGITYLAYDSRLDIAVAIKEYLPKSLASREMTTMTIQPHSPDTKGQFEHHMEKFMDEARAIAKFNHEPGIVSVQDVLEKNNTVYIIMHYVNGITLEEYVKSHGGSLSLDKTLQIMNPVMNSLAKVHKENLIHRDISPDNIYITKDNQVKLLDFGAARYVITEESQSLSIILKPGFAPIEQYSSKGRQGPWTDVYAVSATIYWMLTGVKPQNSMDRMLEDEVVSLKELGADVPVHVEHTIMKGLEINYQQRIQSLPILREMLNDSSQTVLLDDAPSLERPVLETESQRKSEMKEGVLWWKNLKVILPIGAIALVVILFGLSGLLQDETPSADQVDKENESGEQTSDSSDETDSSLPTADTTEDSENATVSDVSGLRLSTAKARLLNEGYDVNIIEEESKEVGAGIVIRNTLAGEQTEKGATINLYVSTGYTGSPIYFGDEAIEEKIRELTGIDSGEILEGDVLRISSLELEDVEIKSLEGIQYLVNLTNLHIGGYSRGAWNQYSDLTPLAKLTKLRHLDIAGSLVSDLEPIAELNQLRTLSLYACDAITDISYLDNMIHMEHLDLRGPRIRDIDALKNMSELHTLVVAGDTSQTFTDLDALKGKNNLEYLEVMWRKIEDISGLSGLPSLRRVNLAKSRADDYSPLGTIPNLVEIEIDGIQTDSGHEGFDWDDFEYFESDDSAENDNAPLIFDPDQQDKEVPYDRFSDDVKLIVNADDERGYFVTFEYIGEGTMPSKYRNMQLRVNGTKEICYLNHDLKDGPLTFDLKDYYLQGLNTFSLYWGTTGDIIFEALPLQEELLRPSEEELTDYYMELDSVGNLKVTFRKNQDNYKNRTMNILIGQYDSAKGQHSEHGLQVYVGDQESIVISQEDLGFSMDEYNVEFFVYFTNNAYLGGLEYQVRDGFEL